MALLESRQVFQTIVDKSMSGVAARGGIAAYDPVSNGNLIYADATAVSGQLANPAGILMEDVEALNFMDHPEYLHRNVSPQGSVVGLITDGEVYTNFVETTGPGNIPVGTYASGDTIYMADNGNVSRNNGTFNNEGTAIRKEIGKALGAVDSDGFLKIRVDL